MTPAGEIMIPVKWIAVLLAKRDVVRALLRSVSCETHENSYAKTLVVRLRFICNAHLIVTGNFVHR